MSPCAAPCCSLGLGSDMVVQDSSAFAAKDEDLSYLQLQVGVGWCRYVWWEPIVVRDSSPIAAQGGELSYLQL